VIRGEVTVYADRTWTWNPPNADEALISRQLLDDLLSLQLLNHTPPAEPDTEVPE